LAELVNNYRILESGERRNTKEEKKEKKEINPSR